MWTKLIQSLVFPCAILAGIAWSIPAPAQAVWREEFEGPDASWRDAGGDGPYKIDSQARVQSDAHAGRSCERLRVTGANGSFVYVSHDIGQARVIAELAVRVWVKADRPGLQILARAVLPRSKDPRTGRPLTTLLRGSGYTQAGSWQQLRVENTPQLLERQLRALRAQFGPQVDAREAFFDQVVLNVYGGPGATNVWIDDLEVSGLMGRWPGAAPATESAVSSESPTVERLPATWSAQAEGTDGRAPADAKFASGALLGGKPFFPRAIEYRGESLTRLQALGFNAVRLADPPSADLLREAARLGLALIAPPPSWQDLQTRAGDPAAKIGTDFDSVIAWDLGQGLSMRDLETTKKWAKLVRSADPRNRPLLCEPDAELRAFSRPVNLLLAHRLPLHSSLELGDYGRWLRERPQLARPGTPLWTIVQTQPSARLAEQWSLLSSEPRPVGSCSDEQIRQLAYGALAAGARGICFQSQSSLEAPGAETELRAAALELINLELELISPWTTAGGFVTTASSNDRKLAGVVMQTQRARLLLPLCAAPQNQFTISTATASKLSFIVPGVPESSDAYELTPTGLRPLAHQRVAGGILVKLGEGQRPSFVLFTQDALVIDTLARRLTRLERRAAELQRTLAAGRLSLVEDVDRRLSQQARALPAAQSELTAARLGVRQADALIAAGDYKGAFSQARRALDGIRQAERGHWEKSLSPLASPIASPLAVSFATLPDHWRFLNAIAAARQSPNRLLAGDCEDKGAMQQSGWRHFQHPQSGIVTEVELSPQDPHGGRCSLHLRVKPQDVQKAPAVVETPPLWITSAPLVVEQGQWFHVHGWARVPTPIAGSVDGLLIMDSIAGESLAERIGQTKGWKEFDLYRGAPRSGPLTVTFALTGLGEAYLDDVTIQLIERSTAARLEQVSRRK